MRRNTNRRWLSSITLTILCVHVVMPALLQAQLQPVPSVDSFTGAFKCAVPLITVPGPHGSGYTIVLNYSSDVRAEDEASWVGYGWSLEPPVITRNRRGLPDDMKERTVTFRSKGKMTSTTVSLFGSGELLATPEGVQDDELVPSLHASGALSINWNSVTGVDVTLSAGVNAAIGMKSPPLALGAGVAYDTKGRFNSGLFGRGGLSSIAAFGTGVSLFTYDPAAAVKPTPSMAPAFSGESITAQLSVRVNGYEGGASVSNLTLTLEDRHIPASGFMYSPDAVGPNGNTGVMVDYLVDRERSVTGATASPLPMPLPGYDEFVVSSPYSTGRFRLFHWLPMYARPADQTSTMSIYSGSLKGIFGATYGGGIGASLPIPVYYTVKSGGIPDFKHIGIAAETASWNNKRQPFFRFMNDDADQVRYAPNVGTLISPSMSALTAWQYHPVNMGQKPRMNRAIQYKTVGELRALIQLSGTDSPLGRWLSVGLAGQSVTTSEVHSPGDLDNEVIGQFSVTSEDGTTVEYGAPEYSAFESTVNYLVGEEYLEQDRQAERVYYRNKMLTSDMFESVSQRDIPHVHATTWNATAIYAPNYIDIHGDGPDPSDVGGWTKFTYTNDNKTPGRRWRYPHRGYLLDRRMPHDTTDDMVAFSKGNHMPIHWRSVETATHIAYLFTDKHPVLTTNEVAGGTSIENYSYQKRYDGHQPSEGDASASETDNDYDDNDNPYLTRIELWVKDANGKPATKLKTIHFAYDYSAFPGNPSSEAAGLESSTVGKLTLRRVWSEDRNVKEATIEPLDFFYQYPVLSGTPQPGRDHIDCGATLDRYPAVSVPTNANESPSFDANDIDAWGYQSQVRPASGSDANKEPQRYSPKQAWDGAGIDPGAWRLKTIRTSSGLRIVPVYEARTYQWVQDKQAMTLASLSESSRDLSTPIIAPTPAEARYYVKLNDLGVTNDPGAHADYVRLIKKRFVDGGEPVYFRFGYDANACSTNGNCYFVRGYAKITDCATETIGSETYLRFRLGNMAGAGQLGTLPVALLLEQTKTTPYHAMIRYWKSYLATWCITPPEGSDVVTGAVSWVLDVSTQLAWTLYPSIVPAPLAVLPRLHPTRSMIRLPVGGSKVGGGARVQKLLMISPDDVLEEGSATALGTEYAYGTKGVNDAEIESFGVATDEPFLMREESALTHIDTAHWIKTATKMIDEEGMATTEWPLAGALLPPPSIGYQQVQIKSINPEPSTPGFVVERFLTAKEVPSIHVTASVPAVSPDHYENPTGPLFTKSELRLGIAQSFKVDVINAHGLPLSIDRYAVNSANDRVLISSLTYEYVPFRGRSYFFRDHASSLRSRANVEVVDVIQETREIKEEMNLYRVDLSGEVAGVLPLIGACGFHTVVDHRVQTNATVAITEYQPRLYRTISTMDGQADTSEVVAWDDQTGMPSITVQSDEFVGRSVQVNTPDVTHYGKVSTLMLPSAKVYRDLGQSAQHYRARFGEANELPGIGRTTASVGTGGVVTIVRIPDNINTDACARNTLMAESFTVGDILNVMSMNGDLIAVGRVTSLTAQPCPSEVQLQCDVLSGTLPSSSANVVVEISKSGRKNMLMSTAATHLRYGLDYEPALERADELQVLEEWGLFCNIGARARYSTRNFKQFEDAQNRLFPFKYDGGPSWQFNPNQGHVQDLEDYLGQSGCASCRANPNQLSTYSYYVHRNVNYANPATPEIVRLGIIRPRQAAETDCPNCGANVSAQDPLTGSVSLCDYHWGWKPGASSDDANPCYQLTWLKFPTSTSFPSGWAVDEYLWDIWRRFYVTDLGRLVVGSVEPPSTAANSGSIHFINGNYPTVVPAVKDNARTLAITLTPYASTDFTIGGKSIRQWYPVTAWMYDADETVDASGQSTTTSARIYADAGTFTSPSIPAYSSSMWQDPLSVDGTPTGTTQRSGWYRSALITRINSHSAAEDIVDVKGLHTVVQYDPTQNYPEAVIHNAYAGTASGASWFENFENGTATSEYFTGRRALHVTSTASIVRPERVPAEGVIADDLIVRAWVKVGQGSTTAELSNLVIGGNTIDAEEVRASVRGWHLVELECPAAVADAVSVAVNNGLAIWIDDLVVHPVTAVSQATVLDQEFRPTASFTADHFPTRTVYQANGRRALATSDVERGRIGSVVQYAHVPGRTRSSSYLEGGGDAFAEGSIPLPAIDSIATAIQQNSRLLDDLLRKIGPQGISANASLLDMTITPDSVKASTVLQPVLDLLKRGTKKKTQADTIKTQQRVGDK